MTPSLLFKNLPESALSERAQHVLFKSMESVAHQLGSKEWQSSDWIMAHTGTKVLRDIVLSFTLSDDEVVDCFQVLKDHCHWTEIPSFVQNREEQEEVSFEGLCVISDRNKAFLWLIDHLGGDMMTKVNETLAIRWVDTPCLLGLLERGLSPFTAIEQNSLLIHTVECLWSEWSHKIFDHLLASGLSLDWQNADGNTALHTAMNENNKEALKWLIEHGANPLIKNAEQQTASGAIHAADEKSKQVRQEALAMLEAYETVIHEQQAIRHVLEKEKAIQSQKDQCMLSLFKQWCDQGELELSGVPLSWQSIEDTVSALHSSTEPLQGSKTNDEVSFMVVKRSGPRL